MREHRLIDERSLAFGRAIAARLARQPELVDRARATLLRWRETSSPALRTTLDEWLSILDGPMEGVIAVLTSKDERSTRLRQSNPFTGVLTPQERNAIIRQFQSYDAASA